MSHPHVFEPAVASANRWVHEIMENLELPPASEPRALHALRAGLHAIRDRLPVSEIVHLGAQLPTIIRGLYYENWTGHATTAEIRTRADMIERVHRELGAEQRLDPTDVLRAVIQLLVEHVSTGEVNHIVATLPRGIAALWQDLTGHAIDEKPAAARSTARLPRTVRHTGYSR